MWASRGGSTRRLKNLGEGKSDARSLRKTVGPVFGRCSVKREVRQAANTVRLQLYLPATCQDCSVRAVRRHHQRQPGAGKVCLACSKEQGLEDVPPLPLYAGLPEPLVTRELADNTSQRQSFPSSSSPVFPHAHTHRSPLRLGTEPIGCVPWRFVAALCGPIGPHFSPGHPAWQRAGGLLCYWRGRRCSQAFSKCSRQPGEISCLGWLSPPGTKGLFLLPFSF